MQQNGLLFLAQGQAKIEGSANLGILRGARSKRRDQAVSKVVSQQILVIEDEDEIREAITDLLSAENFQVIQAKDGETGIQLVQAEDPDLIICDILMPSFDGYQVLNQLRQDPKTATIPLVFLTAKGDKSDLRHGMNLGADDYLVKPFTRQELLNAVQARLEKNARYVDQYMSEQQRLKTLEQKLESLQNFQEAGEEVLNYLVEDLRQNLTKINMAIYMLKNADSESKREQYLQLLKEECDREMALLNQVSELRNFLTPGNVNLLRRYNLLRN